MNVTMNMLEFLKSTNNRSLRNNINSMVEEHVEGWAHNLQLRREQLYCQLRYEQLEWGQALAEWVQARAESAARQRQEWIGLEMLKRERADQELLKLKQQQYDVENCTEMRELQSKQILLETKSAQLYQIEERKELRRREQQIEQMWLKAWQRLHIIRTQQDQYEQKLRRVIANVTQAENSAREEEARLKKTMPNRFKLSAEHAYADDSSTLDQAGNREPSQESVQQQEGLTSGTQSTDNYRRPLVKQQTQLTKERTAHPTNPERPNPIKMEMDLTICQSEIREQPKRSHLETECELQEPKKHPYSKSVR